MITREALDKIEEWVAAASEFSLDKEALVLPKGTYLQDLQHLKERKRRIQAKFETGDIKSFVDYVAAFSAGTMVPRVFVNDLDVTAILDFGSENYPGHCEHVARLKLKQDPEWVQVAREHGAFNQEDFINWVIDWAEFIRFKPSLEEDKWIEQSAAISSIRKITVERLNSTEGEVNIQKTTKTAMESVEARFAGVFPEFLVFRASPSAGLSLRDVLFRVIVKAGEKVGITISLRAIRFGQVMDSVNLEFYALLSDSLADTGDVFIGRVTTQ